MKLLPPCGAVSYNPYQRAAGASHNKAHKSSVSDS